MRTIVVFILMRVIVMGQRFDGELSLSIFHSFPAFRIVSSTLMQSLVAVASSCPTLQVRNHGMRTETKVSQKKKKGNMVKTCA